jgi:5-dehydro-2-deoxygluconokinase
MAVDENDFDEAFIASSKALLITGTHFSTDQVNRTSRRALDYARRNQVRTVLDIDYRPVLWGLTGKADGETRFIANEGVTAHLQSILPLMDLVIGTEEEFRIAGGKDTMIDALAAVARRDGRHAGGQARADGLLDHRWRRAGFHRRCAGLSRR